MDRTLAEKAMRRATLKQAAADREFSRAKHLDGLLRDLALEHARGAEAQAQALRKLARFCA